MRDGLRLPDITVEDAERKRSYSDSKPGVIIARMKNKQEKTRVMTEKRRLKDSRQFSKVFVHHDLHPSQRSISNNFRRIVHAMKNNTSNLSMKDSRILFDRDNQMSHDSRDTFSDNPRENNSRYDSDGSDRQTEHSVSRRDRDRQNNRSYSDRRSSYRRDNTDYSGHDYRQERFRDGRRWRD